MKTEIAIEQLFQKLNSFCQKCAVFAKAHAAGVERAGLFMKRAKRYLAFALVIYVALFVLDGYRYIASADSGKSVLSSFGILLRYFILPLGVFIGVLATCLCASFRPFKQFLRLLARGIAQGILLVCAATGFFGYGAECPAVITIFYIAGAVWICVLLAEKALLFVKDLAETETEAQDEKDV